MTVAAASTATPESRLARPPTPSSWPRRVALVHDMLEQQGGAERVLWALHEMFPDAPIFTAIWNRGRVTRFLNQDVRTSWMQRLPGVQRFPRAYAPLYPLAFATLDLRGFDLVISSSSYFAKGIRTDGLHICYCHSPANFIWRSNAYLNRPVVGAVTGPGRAWLRAWDRWAGGRPDIYVANGETVADRILACYYRTAVVVPPPIERTWFTPHQGNEFYLVVSRLVLHKRIDLPIEACARLGVRLRIVGAGRAAGQLRQLAGPNVDFLGWLPDAEIARLYAHATAVLVPAEEDFGLVALEAQAAGTPVIAYDGGGARETVVHGETGLRFAPQTADALAAAMAEAVRCDWDPERIQSHAAGFDEGHFRRGLTAVIEGARGVR